MGSGELQPSDRFYVASDEVPAPRRPPIHNIGIIGWLRKNLFSSVWDVLLTLITLGVITAFLNGFLDWAIFDAQWEVVFLNLRQLSVGNLFPQSEIWRADLIVYIIVFLTVMSIGVWGRLGRSIVIAIALITAIILIIPRASESVPEPPVHFYMATDYEIRQINFVADEGQTVGFTVDPLTNTSDYELENTNGYIENNNQQSDTSFDAFNERSTQITFYGEDPSGYNLDFAIQVWNRDGEVIYESDYTGGATETLTYEWEAPAKGWYTMTMTFNEESPGDAGAAWVKLQNAEVFRSTGQGRETLLANYGEEPELDCDGCATSLNRTDMRFQGERTLGQFFSLQLSPYLLEIQEMFFTLVVIGAVAYFVGRMTRNVGVEESNAFANLERLLSIIGAGLVVLYLGVQIALIVNPGSTLDEIRFTIVASLLVTAFIYALLQFFKTDGPSVSRGMTVLWLIGIPVIWLLLTGMPVDEGTPTEEATLPLISSDNFGGLLLTLLSSAVAILLSFPIGIGLALGRQSELPVVSLLCTILIEVIRGVPLITLLFMGRLILPFFGFGLSEVDLLIRIMVVLTLFTSAYMAEVIRGGLQIVPKGQVEAAQALGLNAFWTTNLIILPQALRAVIPAMMGQAVSLFKDTSLLYIVGLFEIVGTMNQILGDSQTGYTLFPREGYLYVGIAFFVFSYLMAEISRRAERTGSGSLQRQNL